MLYIGAGGFHPLIIFGLPLPQTTFDQLKIFLRLFKTIDTKFGSQKIS